MLKFNEIVDRLKNASAMDKRSLELTLERIRHEDADDEDFTYYLRDFGESIFEIVCPPEPEDEDEPEPPPTAKDGQSIFYCRNCGKPMAFDLIDAHWVCGGCKVIRYTFADWAPQ